MPDRGELEIDHRAAGTAAGVGVFGDAELRGAGSATVFGSISGAGRPIPGRTPSRARRRTRRRGLLGASPRDPIGTTAEGRAGLIPTAVERRGNEGRFGARCDESRLLPPAWPSPAFGLRLLASACCVAASSSPMLAAWCAQLFGVGRARVSCSVALVGFGDRFVTRGDRGVEPRLEIRPSVRSRSRPCASRSSIARQGRRCESADDERSASSASAFSASSLRVVSRAIPARSRGLDGLGRRLLGASFNASRVVARFRPCRPAPLARRDRPAAASCLRAPRRARPAGARARRRRW